MRCGIVGSSRLQRLVSGCVYARQNRSWIGTGGGKRCSTQMYQMFGSWCDTGLLQEGMQPNVPLRMCQGCRKFLRRRQFYNILSSAQVLMVAVLQDISRVNLSIHCKKFTVNFFGSIEFSRKWHRSLLFKGSLHLADFNSEAILESRNELFSICIVQKFEIRKRKFIKQFSSEYCQCKTKIYFTDGLFTTAWRRQ